MAVAFEWIIPLPTDLMHPRPANTWAIVVLRTVTHTLAVTRIGILTANPTVNVIRTRAVEATETETETLMAATAEIGANVAARLLRGVDDTHPSTEGEGVIQEALPGVAAQEPV